MAVLLEWLRLGGPAMVVLALMSVLGLTLVIVKLWDFSERKIGAREFVAPALAAWERGQSEHALAALAASPSPLAAVVAQAMQTLGDAGLSETQARERIERSALDQIETARTHLRTLDLIASLAPLLGLLGSVLGMIDAFRALEVAGDRVQPAILFGGIWQALLTTAAGLTIAIPAIAAVGYFERRVESLQQAMESALTQLMTTPRRRGTSA
ncbi:MAG: flagellar motor protein MotA [Panacagrimonas sp.]|jgi:biopolymer transport protein ExbB|nr:MotA/TolQ/ExbB proton channel family protein [Panacagrimonas sp.]MCC2655739.1 flagellar motor protein MotA [Panacagrimonas sp.]